MVSAALRIFLFWHGSSTWFHKINSFSRIPKFYNLYDSMRTQGSSFQIILDMIQKPKSDLTKSRRYRDYGVILGDLDSWNVRDSRAACGPSLSLWTTRCCRADSGRISRIGYIICSM
jgi:hypothetical protein